MPRFQHKPEPQEIFEYEEATFVALISGKPKPEVKWSCGDKVLEPSDLAVQHEEDNKVTLTLKDVRRSQAGMYSLRITNPMGTMSASARLKVIPVNAPEIVTAPKDTIAPEQGPVTFSAKITGSNPKVTWFLNEEELVESDTVLFEVDEKKFIYSVTVSHRIKGMSGPVRVHAQNKAGQDEATCKLDVNGRSPEFLVKPIKCTTLAGKKITKF